jgi:hypothetical protein
MISVHGRMETHAMSRWNRLLCLVVLQGILLPHGADSREQSMLKGSVFRSDVNRIDRPVLRQSVPTPRPRIGLTPNEFTLPTNDKSAQFQAEPLLAPEHSNIAPLSAAVSDAAQASRPSEPQKPDYDQIEKDYAHSVGGPGGPIVDTKNEPSAAAPVGAGKTPVAATGTGTSDGRTDLLVVSGGKGAPEITADQEKNEDRLQAEYSKSGELTMNKDGSISNKDGTFVMNQKGVVITGASGK